MPSYFDVLMGDATEDEIDPWWRDNWKPLNTELVQKIRAAIAEVYTYHRAGGNLHVYIDDGNLEDHWFEDKDEMEVVHDTPLAQLFAELVCWDLLKMATEEERFSAYQVR